MFGVEIREGIVKIAGCTDRCHELWIVAHYFIEVTEDHYFATDTLFVCDFRFKIIYALLPWVWFVMSRETEELPLLGVDRGWADFGDVRVYNVVEAVH